MGAPIWTPAIWSCYTPSRQKDLAVEPPAAKPSPREPTPASLSLSAPGSPKPASEGGLTGD